MIKLAIWYLRKRNVSVLLNMKIDGGTIQQKTRYGFTYDSEINNVNYLDADGELFNIPKGKFKVRYTNN